MNIKIKWSHATNYNDLVAVLLIYIITFPRFEIDYSIGLDTSYVWALNFLFFHHYSSLTDLIYPYGPLSLFKNQLVIGYNFEYFILFYTFIKLWFSYIFLTNSAVASKNKINHYLILTFLMYLFDVDMLLIGICFIYCYLLLFSNKTIHFVFSIIVAFTGLCIKSSIGISCFSIIFVSQILLFFQNRNIKQSFFYLGISLVVIFISGILIFQNLVLIIQFLTNTFKLSFSYSSALSIFPNNNWYLLSIFIISVFFPILFINNKKNKYIFFLLLLPLFAMWKHSITRQDYSHGELLFAFLFLYWGFFIVFSEIGILKVMFIATISIFAYYSNLQNTWDFKPKTIELNGIVNFEKTIINLKKFKENQIEQSFKNTLPSKLPDSIIKLIGSASIDSYPWELSYFAANNELNWKTRRTLQGCGGYARWLDKCGAEDFNRKNGPDFIIFHYVPDNWKGNWGSIDNRYLLNDNPLTIYNIFNYYSLFLKTKDFLLLKKNTKDNFIDAKLSKIKNTKWNEWIDLPANNDTVLRMRLFSEKNIIGSLMNFLYKSEEYSVDYMVEDGKIFSYRFIPENAKDGLWINPFIRNPQNEFPEESVVKIRFRCNYPILNKKNLSYQFEKSIFNKKNTFENFQLFFQKNMHLKSNTICLYFNNFDNDINISTSTNYSYSGYKSNIIETNNGYSYTYSLSLDSLWHNIDSSIINIQIATCVKYLNLNSKGVFIISISNSYNDFWEAKNLNFTDKYWNNSMHIININRKNQNTGILKIYAWNTGNDKIYIDDLWVKISAFPNK